MFFSLLIFIQIAAKTMIPDNPTFLVHGIASSKNEMVPLQNYLLSQGIETHNIEIGNGELSSIFMPMNEQCAFLAENIKKTFKNHGYASQKSLNKKFFNHKI